MQIVPYTADWAEQYKDEEMKLFSEIEAYAVDIQHIGSTSVPGLDAKSILDILIGLRNWATSTKERTVSQDGSSFLRGGKESELIMFIWWSGKVIYGNGICCSGTIFVIILK